MPPLAPWVAGPPGQLLAQPPQLTTNWAIPVAATDLLTITFIAPRSGAVALEAYAYSATSGAAVAAPIFYITDNANTVVGGGQLGAVAANTASASVAVKAVVTGLTPGATYTYKLRASSSTASTLTANASVPTQLFAFAA